MQELQAARHPVMKSDIRYAGFWRRVLAYLVDATVLAGVGGILFGAVYAFAPDSLDSLSSLTNFLLVTAVIGWAYSALLESSPAQGTLGKLAIGLYVSDIHGDPITFLRASIRYLLKVFSSLFCFLGWVMPAFTPKKQALHDLLAGTLVLRRSHYLVFGTEAPTEPGEHWDGTSWVASIPPLERS